LQETAQLQLCTTLQRTATHCNALQRTATHYNALQRTVTHCKALQHTATHYTTLQRAGMQENAPLQLCTTLQHTATHCNALQRTATHCNALEKCSNSSQTTFFYMQANTKVMTRYICHKSTCYISRKLRPSNLFSKRLSIKYKHCIFFYCMQANAKVMTDPSTSHLSQFTKKYIYMQANAKMMTDLSASHLE